MLNVYKIPYNSINEKLLALQILVIQITIHRIEWGVNMWDMQ